MQHRAPDPRILRSEALLLSKRELYGEFHSNKNKETVSHCICSFKYIPAVLVDETCCCWEDWALEQHGSTRTSLLSAECCLSVEISSRTQNQTDSS